MRDQHPSRRFTGRKRGSSGPGVPEEKRERKGADQGTAQRDAHGPSLDGERVAKVMARAGLCSRREAEDWILAGRVSVNGKIIRSPALDLQRGDQVAVDGQPLPTRERTRLFLYHKPRGRVTTTHDPEGRPTVFNDLPADLPRLISVGRLDYNTEGLLLLTNDGGLARSLELPKTAWLRRYRVRAHGTVSQADLDALRDGIELEGVRYGPIEAVLDRSQPSNVWITIGIREGKNREVRNVLSHLGLDVARLIRVSFGPFQLGELAAGAVEEVKTRTLRDQLGERLAREAQVDFDAPVREAETDTGRRRPAKARPSPRGAADRGSPTRQPAAPQRRTEHVWRAEDDERRAARVRPERGGFRARPEKHGDRRPESSGEQRPERGGYRARPDKRDDRRPTSGGEQRPERSGFGARTEGRPERGGFGVRSSGRPERGADARPDRRPDKRDDRRPASGGEQRQERSGFGARREGRPERGGFGARSSRRPERGADARPDRRPDKRDDRRPASGGERRPESGAERRPDKRDDRRPENRRPERGAERRPDKRDDRRPAGRGERRPEGAGRPAGRFGDRRDQPRSDQRPRAGGSRDRDGGPAAGGGRDRDQRPRPSGSRPGRPSGDAPAKPRWKRDASPERKPERRSEGGRDKRPEHGRDRGPASGRPQRGKPRPDSRPPRAR